MSFFESLVEGTANAAANSLGNYQKRQQVLEDDERNQQQAIERFRQQQQIQQDMAEKARQEQQARLQEQMIKAEQGGAVLDAQARTQQLTGAGVGDVSTLTPEQEAMIAKGRGLKYGDSLSQLDNQLKSARDNGLFDAASALASARKEAVQAIRDERDFNFKERNAANAEAKTEAMIRRGDQQFEVGMARAEAIGRGASGANGPLSQEKLDVAKAKEKRLDIERQSADIVARRKEGLISKQDAAKKLEELDKQRNKYAAVENAGSAPPAAASAGNWSITLKK